VAGLWIDKKGIILLNQYSAIRNENGIYCGAVEVSQEIMEIQNLTGERRHLDL